MSQLTFAVFLMGGHVFTARFVTATSTMCFCLIAIGDIVSAQNRPGPAPVTGQAPTVHRRTPFLVIPSVSLQQAMRDSEAVVLGRVTKRYGTRIVDRLPYLLRTDTSIALTRPQLEPYTEYEVTVIEVIKPHSERTLDPVMRVAHPGGIGRLNNIVIDEDSGIPELVEGRQYLLFLRYSDFLDQMLFQTFGVFDFGGKTVEANEALRGTRHGKELIGLPPDRALASVRRLIAERER
jgi:hypothetical protein